MANLDNGLKEIKAGTTVTDFLGDINNNFRDIQNALNNTQKTIQIKNSNELEESGGVPIGGESGDIWIVYEE